MSPDVGRTFHALWSSPHRHSCTAPQQTCEDDDVPHFTVNVKQSCVHSHIAGRWQSQPLAPILAFHSVSEKAIWKGSLLKHHSHMLESAPQDRAARHPSAVGRLLGGEDGEQAGALAHTRRRTGTSVCSWHQELLQHLGRRPIPVPSLGVGSGVEG